MTQDILQLNIYQVIGFTLGISACLLFTYACGYQKGVDDTKNDFTNPFNKKRHG
jgi:hypothetical protein